MQKSIATLILALFTSCLSFAEEGYEAGRGLITLEGPTGMFINPTSATLPRETATAQYCIFLPNNETDVVGHGAIVSLGFEDWLELGGQLSVIDGDDTLLAGGPNLRTRITKDDGRWVPQISLGAFSRFGDDLMKMGAYGAAYRRLPISDDGFFRAVGLHGGLKYVDVDAAEADGSIYGGVEVQFPLRIYLVSEVATESKLEVDVPYSFGLQWRAAGINMSLAGIQNGNLDEPSFYYGIGYGRQF